MQLNPENKLLGYIRSKAFSCGFMFEGMRRGSYTWHSKVIFHEEPHAKISPFITKLIEVM